jgi:hypothetical protein
MSLYIIDPVIIIALADLQLSRNNDNFCNHPEYVMN